MFVFFLFLFATFHSEIKISKVADKPHGLGCHLLHNCM